MFFVRLAIAVSIVTFSITTATSDAHAENVQAELVDDQRLLEDAMDDAVIDLSDTGENADMEVFKLIQAAPRTAQAGDRSPAVEGPGTPYPQGENAHLYED